MVYSFISDSGFMYEMTVHTADKFPFKILENVNICL